MDNEGIMFYITRYNQIPRFPTIERNDYDPSPDIKDPEQ